MTSRFVARSFTALLVANVGLLLFHSAMAQAQEVVTWANFAGNLPVFNLSNNTYKSTVALGGGTTADLTILGLDTGAIFSALDYGSVGAATAGLNYTHLQGLGERPGGSSGTVPVTLRFDNIHVGAAHIRGYLFVGAVNGGSSPVTFATVPSGIVGGWTPTGTFPLDANNASPITWNPSGTLTTTAPIGDDSAGIFLATGSLAQYTSITISLSEARIDGIGFSLGEAISEPCPVPGSTATLLVGNLVTPPPPFPVNPGSPVAPAPSPGLQNYYKALGYCINCPLPGPSPSFPIPGYPWPTAYFSTPVNNQWLIHTFDTAGAIPPDQMITDATLDFVAQGTGDALSNDGWGVRQFDGEGRPQAIVRYSEPLWQSGAPAGGVLVSRTFSMLQQGQAMINALNTLGHLDFNVQDDTEVDYARLTLTLCPVSTHVKGNVVVAPIPVPVQAGTLVDLTASVTGSAPTGRVQFLDNLGSVPNAAAILGTVALAGGTATLTTRLTEGPHLIEAVYLGDASNWANSSAPVAVTVGPAVLAVPAVGPLSVAMMSALLLVLGAATLLASSQRRPSRH